LRAITGPRLQPGARTWDIDFFEHACTLEGVHGPLLHNQDAVTFDRHRSSRPPKGPHGRSSTERGTNRDLARIVLSVLLIFVLIAASFWILRPFLLAIVWAAMIAVATWPLMLKLHARLRSRALRNHHHVGRDGSRVRRAAVARDPDVVDNADTIKQWGSTLATASIPPPPDWVLADPLAGAKLVRGVVGGCRVREARVDGALCARTRRQRRSGCSTRSAARDPRRSVPAHRHHHRDHVRARRKPRGQD
jgi:hypothetical protein